MIRIDSLKIVFCLGFLLTSLSILLDNVFISGGISFVFSLLLYGTLIIPVLDNTNTDFVVSLLRLGPQDVDCLPFFHDHYMVLYMVVRRTEIVVSHLSTCVKWTQGGVLVSI